MATFSTTHYIPGGKGILSAALITGGVIGTYMDLGNCSGVEFEPTSESLEHLSSRAQANEADKESIVKTGWTLTGKFDSINIDNMALMMNATKSGAKLLINMDLTKEHAFKFVSDNPDGPNYTVNLWRGKFRPNGAFSLIGDSWMEAAFTVKGLSDRTGHPTSPFGEWEFTTTTSTTTTTAAATTTTI